MNIRQVHASALHGFRLSVNRSCHGIAPAAPTLDTFPPVAIGSRTYLRRARRQPILRLSEAMKKSDYELLCQWSGMRSLFDLAWRLFKVNLAFVSPDGEQAACYDMTRRQAPFCQALQRQNEGRRLCYECDRRFYREVLQQSQPLRYRCHAGLTEFIVPVIRHGQVIGLLQCGQVLETKPSATDWQVTREQEARQGLNPDLLEPFYYHSRILPPPRQADLMMFLQFIADYVANIDTPWLDASASRNQETLRRIMNHVEAHLAEDLSLNAIARGAGVSSRTLSRLFQRESGMTVLDFVHHRRVARASHYLGTTDLSCIEIAFAVGYQSVQNFNRIFRRLKDTTPREWRLALAQRSPPPARVPAED